MQKWMSMFLFSTRGKWYYILMDSNPPLQLILDMGTVLILSSDLELIHLLVPLPMFRVSFIPSVTQGVQVMGSFDGWSQGEEMSPEYSGGDYARFSATLRLRPGRYQLSTLSLMPAFLFLRFFATCFWFLSYTWNGSSLAMKVWDQVLGGWRMAPVTRIAYCRWGCDEKQSVDCN